MFDQIKYLAKQIKQEFRFYQLLAKHPDTPWLAKAFFMLAIGYLLLPFDLIPDFIPLLGQLDDMVIIPLFIYVALKLTPASVIAACRESIK